MRLRSVSSDKYLDVALQDNAHVQIWEKAGENQLWTLEVVEKEKSKGSTALKKKETSAIKHKEPSAIKKPDPTAIKHKEPSAIKHKEPSSVKQRESATIAKKPASPKRKKTQSTHRKGVLKKERKRLLPQMSPPQPITRTGRGRVEIPPPLRIPGVEITVRSGQTDVPSDEQSAYDREGVAVHFRFRFGLVSTNIRFFPEKQRPRRQFSGCRRGGSPGRGYRRSECSAT